MSDATTRPDAASGDAPQTGAAAGVPQGDGAAPVAPAPTPEASGGERRSGSRAGALARWAAAALAGLAVLIGGALLLLQTEAARLRVQAVAVQQIANLLADDATVRVDRLEGNFLTGARLVGLEIERDGETVAAVDTVLVDYDLTTLLRQRFSASRLAVLGPRVFVRQRPDSTFNVAGLLKPAEDDSTASAFVVEIDEVAVQRGAAEVRWYNADRDSVLAVRDLTLSASGLHSSDDSLAAAIDGLSLVAVAPEAEPGVGPAALARIAASGAFSREVLDLTALSVESDGGTDVAGSVRLRLPQEGDDLAIPVFDADLRAEPLALADVRAFSGARIFGRPRVRLQATSDGEAVDLTLRGALDPESGGGQPATVALEGQVSPGIDGRPLAIRLDGELRRLNPADLLGDPALAADVNGTLTADLRGGSPQALTGPFELALTETRLAGRAIDRLRVDGRFQSGTVEFTADAGLPGLAARARGLARPFERVPALEATGTISELDLARLTGDPARQGRLRGDFAVEGRGTSLATLTGSAALALDEATFPLGENTLRLGRSDLDAVVRGGDVSFDANVALAQGGRIAAAGTAELDREPLAYAVTRGRFSDLDIAALTGDPAQRSDLNGAFTLAGRGVSPQGIDLRATLDLGPSVLPVGEEGFTLAGGRATARLSGGALTFDAAADLGEAGSLTAEGTARPFARPLAYDVSGTFSRLDLAALTGNPDQASDLTGAFTARGSGVDPQALSAAGTLRLESGYVGNRDIDGADLAFSLRGGALALSGTVALPEGQFALDVTGNPFDATPTFALGERTCFTGLDVGRFADNPGLSTDLNGCFRGSITGFDPETAAGSGVITLRPSRINAAQVRTGEVAFSLNDGFVSANADLTLEASGAAAVAADGEAPPEASRIAAVFTGDLFAEEPTYALTGRTESLDLNAILPAAPAQPFVLSSSFDLRGRGLDPLTAQVTGEIAGEPSSIGFARIEALDLDFALDRGTLRLDTLLLRSDIADLSGGGQIAAFDTTKGTDFRLRGEARDLAPLAATLGQTLTADSVALDLTVRGPAGEPLAVRGDVAARTFAYGGTTVAGLDANLDATLDLQRVFEGSGIEARLATDFRVLEVGNFRAENGDLTLGFDGEDITLAGDVIVDGDRDVGFAARVEIDPEPDLAPGGIGLDLEAVNLRLGETRWTLAQPSRVVVGEAILVRGLLLQTEGGASQIAADGRIDVDGDLAFILTAEEVDMGTLTDLANLGNLGGTLSAALVLSGPAAAPVIEGTVSLDRLTSGGELFGALDAQVDYRDSRINLDAVLTHHEGQDLTIEGYIPQRISLAGGAPEAVDTQRDGGVDLTLNAEAFPIAWAQPFLANRGYTELGGDLRVDNVRVRGQRTAPRLSGEVTLTDGRLGLAATGLTYEPLTARLGFEDDRILLEDVRILNPASGETDLAVTGAITLRELAVGELDLTIQPEGFVAIDTRTYDRLVLDRGSRPLRLTGTLQAPRLRGAVVVTSGDIFLTDELASPDLEQVSLTEEEVQIVEDRFGRTVGKRDTLVNRFTDVLDYALDVEIDRNVWLRSRSGLPFDIEFAGSVGARKPSRRDPRDPRPVTQLTGTINLVRGNVETLGRRFELERGTLQFSGPATEARVDLLATLEARLRQNATQTPIEINLSMSGRLDQNPEIRLSSPQLADPADIASVVATGQLSGDLFGSNAVTGALTGAGLGYFSSLVEGIAGEQLGLDLVEIDTDGSDLVIRVGKYLTNAVFASVGYVAIPSPNDRGVTEDTRFIGLLDYELKRWLVLQGEYSGERGVGGGLRYEFAW